MKPLISLIGVAFVSLTLAGCSDDPPPPPFEACGAKTAKISGRFGLFSFQNKPLDFDESSTDSVSVNVPSASTGTALDSTNTSGSQTFDASSGSRTFTTTGMSTLYNVSVTGTVNADCTGSGRWSASRKSSGTRAGSGTWKIE